MNASMIRNRYVGDSVATASPARLVTMLYDRLVRDLAGNSGLGGGMQLGLMAGLSFVGRPAEIDGKKAVAVPLRFNDGAVFLGPIRLGRMEPLY